MSRHERTHEAAHCHWITSKRFVSWLFCRDDGVRSSSESRRQATHRRRERCGRSSVRTLASPQRLPAISPSLKLNVTRPLLVVDNPTPRPNNRLSLRNRRSRLVPRPRRTRRPTPTPLPTRTRTPTLPRKKSRRNPSRKKSPSNSNFHAITRPARLFCVALRSLRCTATTSSLTPTSS